MKIKKAVLIEPDNPSKSFFDYYKLPRLGPLIIGKILQRRGIEVKVYIESMGPIDWKAVREADLVGISMLTTTAPKSYKIAERANKLGKITVAGGVHPTFASKEVLQHFDYVVTGEGEETIGELIEAIESEEGFEKIAGLSYKKDGEVIKNTHRPLIDDLDSVPIPDISLIKEADKLIAHSKRGMFPRFLYPVATSRGCPFGCKFCSVTTHFGRGFRFRSIENVMEELKQVKAAGFRKVFFYDDNFSANKRHSMELMDAMIDAKLGLEWNAQVRSDISKDEALLKKMQEAGCKRFYIGFESFNPETLKAYNKSQTVEDIKKAIKKIHEFGIKIHGMFVLGSDDDTKKSIRHTAKVARRIGIATAQFFVLTPIPGSEIFDEFKSQGRLLTKKWNLFNGHYAVFKPKNMSAIVLQEEALRATRKFYSWGMITKRFLRGRFSDAIMYTYANQSFYRFRPSKIVKG